MLRDFAYSSTTRRMTENSSTPNDVQVPVQASSVGPINRDLFELSIGFGLIMIAVWSPPSAQPVLYWITFSWILSVLLLARRDHASLGLSFRSIHRSLWVVGVALMLALIQIADFHPAWRASPDVWSGSCWQPHVGIRYLGIPSATGPARLLPAPTTTITAKPEKRCRHGRGALRSRSSSQSTPDGSDSRLGSCRVYGIPQISQPLYARLHPRNPRTLHRRFSSECYSSPHAGRSRLPAL